MSRPAAEIDGRRLRREHNREAVIGALIALFDDGIYQPSAAQIAARAGLSPRSLFRYFSDVDDLHRAAAARLILLALPLIGLGVGPQAPTQEKIDRVVQARGRLYDQIAPAATALRLAVYRHESLAHQLRRNREFLRSQLRDIFAPELEALACPGATLAAVDVLCSFESWQLLRLDQEQSAAAAAATLTASLSALLIRPAA